MHSLQQRVFICGFDERIQFRSRDITHLVTIGNPRAESYHAPWFRGAHLELQFGDVASEADAKRYGTTAPSSLDIQRALSFFRDAWTKADSKILVSCDYGASRSPALAYLYIADHLGPGSEAEAFSLILEIRPVAVPNGMVVRLGDAVLGRRGALIAPLKDFYAKINEQLFPKKA